MNEDLTNKFSNLPEAARTEILGNLMSEGCFNHFVLERADPNVALAHPKASFSDRLEAIDAAIRRDISLSRVPAEVADRVAHDLASGDHMALERARKIGLPKTRIIGGLDERLAQTKRYRDAVETAKLLLAEETLPGDSARKLELNAYDLVGQLIEFTSYCLSAQYTGRLGDDSRTKLRRMVDEVWGLNDQAFPALRKALTCPLELSCKHGVDPAKIVALLQDILNRQPISLYL